MKRFFFEIGISIVLIVIGASLCFFELTDYDHVYQDEVGDVESVTVAIDEHHPLRLKLDDNLIVQYEYDETMKNEVEIEYHSISNRTIIRLKSRRHPHHSVLGDSIMMHFLTDCAIIRLSHSIVRTMMILKPLRLDAPRKRNAGFKYAISS